MRSRGWSMHKKCHVCTRLQPSREKCCGEPCFITCWWTSTDACRRKTERQFDGCDCFGSRSVLLTTAGPRFRRKKTELATVGPAWQQASVFTSNPSSEAQDRATLENREGQPRGVTCLCVLTAQVTACARAEEHRPSDLTRATTTTARAASCTHITVRRRFKTDTRTSVVLTAGVFFFLLI